MGYFNFFAKDQTKTKKIEREKIKHKWRDVNDPIKFVNQHGKLLCPYCSNPFGNFRVTSNRVSLQDTLYTTNGDRIGAPMPNLVFKGICTFPKWGSTPPPCKAVIQLGQWKDTSETIIDIYPALLRKSTIPCMHSMQDISIVHSGQKAVLSAFVPRLEDAPRVVKIYWKGFKFGALREDIMLNHQIELHIDVRNCEEGDDITLDVKHSKGRRIKGGASEFQITGKVNQDNELRFHDFMIESDFEDDNLDFDKIEFYHDGEFVQSFIENFGWNYIRKGDLVKIYVNVYFEVSKLVEGCTEDDYKAAINEQFNRTLQLSSDGKFSGRVFFLEAKPTYDPPQVVHSFNIDVKSDMVAGMSSIGGVSVKLDQIDNGLLLMDLGETSVHELIHTVRISHPFDDVQTIDTELLRNENRTLFFTTQNTDPSIFYNIMMYNNVNIDGYILGELWQKKRPEYLTKGQLSFILNQIDLQKNGHGCTNSEYNYSEWWAIFDGDEVKIKENEK